MTLRSRRLAWTAILTAMGATPLAARAVWALPALSTNGAYTVSLPECASTGACEIWEKYGLRGAWRRVAIVSPTAPSRTFTEKRTGVYRYRAGQYGATEAVVEVHRSTDVGVIAGEAECANGIAPITMFMDNCDGEFCEDYQAKLMGDWWGTTWNDGNGNTTFRFCRVDGTLFGPLFDPVVAGGPSPAADYAVLKLGPTCPAGSQEFQRFIDNQDDWCNQTWGVPCYSNTNSHTGDISPNYQDGNYFLVFCMFRFSPTPDGRMMPHVSGDSPFPALGMSYGVYASSNHTIGRGLKGTVFTRDEHSGNSSTYPYFAPGLEQAAAKQIIVGTPGYLGADYCASPGTAHNMMSAMSCGGGWCTTGACAPGYADCNGDPNGDGCETTLASDPNNCGACGAVCSSNHVSSTCAGGMCQVGTCAAGWGDCNGNKQADGCETNLTSTVNCGGCGITCSANHATPACSGGSCAGTCAAGWADCNGNMQADGCETSLDTSSNCGACGRGCAAGQFCSGGTCRTPAPQPKPKTCTGGRICCEPDGAGGCALCAPKNGQCP